MDADRRRVAVARPGPPAVEPAQRLARDALDPKRVAALWQDAPSAIAVTTRSRRSIERADGIEASWAHQRLTYG